MKSILIVERLLAKVTLCSISIRVNLCHVELYGMLVFELLAAFRAPGTSFACLMHFSVVLGEPESELEALRTLWTLDVLSLVVLQRAAAWSGERRQERKLMASQTRAQVRIDLGFFCLVNVETAPVCKL